MKKTVVISGTSRGIGLELTRQLLGAGMKVHALARHPERAEGLAKLARDFPEALVSHACDVDSDDSVRSFAAKLGSEAVDLLINNAGVYLDGEEGFEALSSDQLMRSFSVNAVGPMRLTRALLPALRRGKLPKVASVTSLMGSISDNTSGGSYAYRMSKTALNMFARSFAHDYPEILTVVLHPGWVQTEMGGKQAPTSIEDSARGMLQVIAGLSQEKSGSFFDFEGDELPW